MPSPQANILVVFLEKCVIAGVSCGPEDDLTPTSAQSPDCRQSGSDRNAFVGSCLQQHAKNDVCRHFPTTGRSQCQCGREAKIKQHLL